MRERKLNTKAVKLTRYRSVGEFLDARTLDNGYLAVDYNGYPIDSYIRRGDSGVMVVVFHAAMMGEFTYPVFQGGGVLSGLDVTRVAISDPTIGQTQLGLSWYAGSQTQPDLQWVVRGIIDKIAQLTDTQHIVFFGTSGGGFAALEYSRRFPGSLALPVNPQTAITRHRPSTVNLYTDTVWPGESPLATQSASRIRYDQTVEYIESFPNTVAYLQNSRDEYHITQHLLPFLRTVGGHPSLRLLLGAWGNPAKNKHVPPEKPQLVRIMKELVSAEGDWLPAMESLGFSNDTDPSTIRDRAVTLNDADVH